MENGGKILWERQKSKLFSFEFWQKFGKALMVVVAVMPAAGSYDLYWKTYWYVWRY